MLFQKPLEFSILKICCLIGVFWLVNSNSIQAQDTNFSQFLRNKQLLNPAYTGIGGGWVGVLQLREQWWKVGGQVSVPGNYASYFLSGEYSGDTRKNSLGFYLMQNEEGTANFRTQIAAANYSYVLPWQHERTLSKHNLRLGFGLYYTRKTIDWERLIFSDQLDAKEGLLPVPSAHASLFQSFEDNPPWWVGLNTGFLYRMDTDAGRSISVGFSTSHVLNLINPAGVESLQSIGTSIPAKFTLHGTAFFPNWQLGTKENRITPIPAFRIDYQGGLNSFMLGADLLFKNVSFGVYYQNVLKFNPQLSSRNTDALVLFWDFAYFNGKKRYLEVGFSYDINITGLGNSNTGGTMEISFKFRNRAKGKFCPHVSSAHQKRWENIFHRKQEVKNVN